MNSFSSFEIEYFYHRIFSILLNWVGLNYRFFHLFIWCIVKGMFTGCESIQQFLQKPSQLVTLVFHTVLVGIRQSHLHRISTVLGIIVVTLHPAIHYQNSL